jgi:hypothetical protein
MWEHYRNAIYQNFIPSSPPKENDEAFPKRNKKPNGCKRSEHFTFENSHLFAKE